jgi:hypothetical protein
MPLPRQPFRNIVPVVTRTVGIEEDRVHNLLGTAFMVGKGLFMSAHHVFGVIPAVNQEIAVILNEDNVLTLFAAQMLYQDSNHDIAVARVEHWPDFEPLSIDPTDNLTMNLDIVTVEYSPTQSGVQLSDGRSAMAIAANWHKGNIIREYTPSFGYSGTTACIDLSFPALKGASGAPVIQEQSGKVLGMIVANIERQLMPAQIERTELPDGSSEEIRRYLLPSAQAIRASHLREALSCATDDNKEISRERPKRLARAAELFLIRSLCAWRWPAGVQVSGRSSFP